MGTIEIGTVSINRRLTHLTFPNSFQVDSVTTYPEEYNVPSKEPATGDGPTADLS